jgi:hypothetical protein
MKKDELVVIAGLSLLITAVACLVGGAAYITVEMVFPDATAFQKMCATFCFLYACNLVRDKEKK